MRFCLTRSWSARKRRPPAGISNMPVSTPSASATARTLRPWSRPRRAMSSASSSDRDAGLHMPDVRLRQDQLVERDVTRGRERDLLNGSHVGYSARAGREPLSRPSNPHEAAAHLYLSGRSRRAAGIGGTEAQTRKSVEPGPADCRLAGITVPRPDPRRRAPAMRSRPRRSGRGSPRPSRDARRSRGR